MLQSRATSIARLLPWLLAALVLLHAAVFAGRIANPLVYSDNWTFIETFLKVALEDGAGIGDVLVKRAGVDHAQPFNKLLMLANARWFGLDFRLEAWVALAAAVAGWALLCVVAARERIAAGERPALTAMLLAALLAAQLAPVHVDVYAYPMVLLTHVVTLSVLAMLVTAWRAYRGGAVWPMVLAAATCGMVGDNAALVAVVAAALALGLAGWRERDRRAWRTTAGLLLVLLGCRLAYAWLGDIRGSTNPAFDVGAGVRATALAAQWRDAWAWAATPLSGGLVSAPALRRAFGDDWLVVRLLVALPVALAHVWFWWRALRVRPGATWFVAVALMLLFYGLVAGLLWGRVFLRGAGFLDQGRYAIFYQLGIAALVLMALAPGALATARARAYGWAAAAALLVLQIPVARAAWLELPAHRTAYLHMAQSMAAMARDPLHPPADCTLGIDVCVRPAETRVALMAMLVERRLNLFSPAFQRRHPDLAAAVRAPPPP